MMFSKLHVLGVLAVAACSPEQEQTGSLRAAIEQEQTANGSTLSKVKIRGKAADVFLNDGDTAGGLLVSKDDVDGTTAIDFQYLSPTSNSAVSQLTFGVAQIANSAFTIGNTSAQLTVSGVAGQECLINNDTGEFTCEATTVSFNLTWAVDGIDSTFEKVHRLSTVGPVTTRFHGSTNRRSAEVAGTWTGHTATDNSGFLLDSQGSTVVREVEVEPAP